MELRSVTLTGTSTGPHLLITGGVHGDEFEPMVAIRRLMRRIDPATLRGRVTFVPVVNEPAFRRCDRAADDGLDLARTCPGRADGSLTEQIADALARLIRTADFYIDLHTGGTRWNVAPLSGYTLHPDPTVLDWQRRMARAFNLPIIWGTDYRLEGRSLSVARDANVPAIYTEYLGAATCDPAGIDAYVDGCLDVMGELGLLDRPARPSRVEHVVEDPRPSSGHMQLYNPAPVEGYFEPAIELGQSIREGELVGTISDVLGEDVRQITSQQTGIVAGLRTFPRVAVGDALAVIVDTNYAVK